MKWEALGILGRTSFPPNLTNGLPTPTEAKQNMCSSWGCFASMHLYAYSFLKTSVVLGWDSGRQSRVLIKTLRTRWTTTWCVLSTRAVLTGCGRSTVVSCCSASKTVLLSTSTRGSAIECLPLTTFVASGSSSVCLSYRHSLFHCKFLGNQGWFLYVSYLKQLNYYDTDDRYSWQGNFPGTFRINFDKPKITADSQSENS